MKEIKLLAKMIIVQFNNSSRTQFFFFFDCIFVFFNCYSIYMSKSLQLIFVRTRLFLVLIS